MATTSIRSAAKKALVDILSPAFAAFTPPVPVNYGWPGHPMNADGVYVVGPGQHGSAGSGETYPVMMAGRKQRDDIFTLEVVLEAVVPGGKPYDADQHAEALFKVLENTLALDQTLSSLDGVISVLLGAQISGPDGEVIEIGARSQIVADVSVHSRLF